MLRREGDSPFAAFAHSKGVEAYYVEAEQENEARRLAAKAGRQAKTDVDPRMFDPEAVTLAAEQGISWGQFVLECLRVRPVKLGAPTMRTMSKEKAYEMTERLGFGSSVLDEPILCGVASYDRLPQRWIVAVSPEQLGIGAVQSEYIGPVVMATAQGISVVK